MYAVLIFVAATACVRLMPERIFPEGDSVHLRYTMLRELEILEKKDSPPKLALFGSSRSVEVQTDALATASGLTEKEVVNLSRPGNDFFFIKAVIERNPEWFSELDMILIDILPYQIMVGENFTESGAYFLRNASLDQKLHARTSRYRLKAILDLIVPAWSKSQHPFLWKMGIERLGMSDGETRESIESRPLRDIANRKSLQDEISKSRREGRIMHHMAYIIFTRSIISYSQISSLHEIRALLPDSCEIALVSLPMDANIHAFIDENPVLRESNEALEKAMSELPSSDFGQYWYPHPEDLDLSQDDYVHDGLHFEPKGTSLVTEEFGTIYKNRDKAGIAGTP